MNWPKLRKDMSGVKNCRGTQSQGSPTLSCFYLQELNPFLTVNIMEKLPLASRRGREKEPFWNIPEHSILNKNSLPGKLLNQLTLLWFYQRLIDLREMKYPTPAPSNISHRRKQMLIPSLLQLLVPPKGRKLKSTCEVNNPEIQVS